MKKSIFTLLLITSGFLFTNAIENPVKKNETTTELNEINPHIYHYTVQTTKNVFTGTAQTKIEAVKQMHRITKSNDVVSKTLTKVELDEKKYGDKVFLWGTSTARGYASGVSKTLQGAKEKINLVGSTTVTQSKIIKSFDTVK